MTNPSRSPSLSTVKQHRDHGTTVATANRLAADAKRRWEEGEKPDVAHLLQLHPELKSCKSVVLDLAHEEFRRRRDAGESIDTTEFCRRFPSFQNSLQMMIEVHRLLGGEAGLQSLFAEPLWPLPGESFVGYSLIAELGRGTFARVFLASEPALGDRLVALKVSPVGGGEAEIIGKLRHPNIVAVYSVKEDPPTGLTAICMPYLGRTTLADVLDQPFANGGVPTDAVVIANTIAELHDDPDLLQAASFDQALRRGPYVDAIIHLATQVADALAFAHAQAVCHLDLKPTNILLSVEGKPLLLDFNLSADPDVDNWRVGGTLPYMAPEQLRAIAEAGRGGIAPPDPRSDLFALGVILYQLLCGELPFGPLPQDSSVEQVAEKLLYRLEQGPLSLRQRNRSVDGPLANLIESTLAFDPVDRPPSAEVLAESLRRQIAPARRARRWSRNHPRSVVAAALLLVAILASSGTMLALRDPYDVRQFTQGVQYMEQGENELASKCFDCSLAANPDNPEVYFARGRVRQRLGYFDLAAIDFRNAYEIKPEAKVRACEGFCATKLNQHDKAALCYSQAVASGFESPGLLNNLGFALIMLNRPAEAEPYLKKAIKAAPGLQAAHNNVVLLNLRQLLAGEPVTEAMLLHAERTAETAPPSGELNHHVALLLLRAGRNDRRWVQPAKDYLQRAVANGVAVRAITSDPAFSYLRDDPELRAILNRPVSQARLVKPDRVVDPLDAD